MNTHRARAYENEKYFLNRGEVTQGFMTFLFEYYLHRVFTLKLPQLIKNEQAFYQLYTLYTQIPIQNRAEIFTAGDELHAHMPRIIKFLDEKYLK